MRIFMLFTQKGTIHQPTCINTPQQNGVTEQKNRHLLKVAWALMFARNNSKQFGGDAILAAAYLVNRMPSKVLDSKTPIGTLEQYISHILCLGSHWLEKFFGCTAFIHIPSKDPSKLDHKAIKCIFLGYYPTQKGYKYYHQPS